MDDKTTGEVKVQATPPKTRRNTRATAKSSTSNTKNTVSNATAITNTRRTNTKAPQPIETNNDMLEKATLKAMAVSLVEAIDAKEGETIAEKIKQLDKSLKAERKIKQELANNMKKLAKYQTKVAKLEEKINQFDATSKNLQEKCTGLKDKIDLYKDELATEISKL